MVALLDNISFFLTPSKQAQCTVKAIDLNVFCSDGGAMMHK